MPKSIIIKKNGGPEVLELQDVKVGSPGPDEIKVTNYAIGLNYIDTYHRSGLYPLTLPSGIGLEASGKIEEVGSNVTEFNKGDNIAYASMPIGAYSHQRIIPSNIAVKLPDGISHKIAATLMTKGLTTNYLLTKTYILKAGDIILFHAAAGGVGLIASQWARSAGCKMIGTVSTKEKASLAKEHGCEFIINYKEEKVSDKVMEITNNQGVPVVYDGVGKDTFDESIKCLSTRGLMVSFGQSSGMVEKIDMHKTFNPKSLFYTRPSLMGYTLNREELINCSNKVFDKIKNGDVKTNIFKKFKLNQAREAHKTLQSRESFGSIILEP